MTRSWIRSAAMLAVLCASAGAFAQPRVFPGNSTQVHLDSIGDNYLTVNGAPVRMSASVLVYGPSNSTMVRGALQANTYARIQFNEVCEVRRVWVLTDEETTPVSFFESLFGVGNAAAPTCPSQ